jgi:hypothetical protein
MLIKCICTNCSGHLEFEEENAGEHIECPHCGWETTLYDASMAQPEDKPLGIRARIRRHARVLWVAGALALVLAGAVWAANRWGFPIVQQFFPLVEGRLILVIILGLAVWVLLAAVLWTVFPLVLLFQVHRLMKLLKHNEMRVHPAPPPADSTEPTPKP